MAACGFTLFLRKMQEKLKIGILFGGNSREREISFAGGRTVYDNLDKSLFEAVPVFIDSFGNFILINWEYIYKIKFKTMPMDKKLRFFELGINPFQRELSEHIPEYIPRAIRPEIGRAHV